MGVIKVGDTLCTAYDKGLENEGYVKLDLLGLKTLDIIQSTLDLTGAKLPKVYDDLNVFHKINESPLGIFQLEEASGTAYIKKAPLTSFADLYNATALLRPGSKDTGDMDKYIERLHDPSKIQYDHPDLIPILEDTKGLIVFQEQQQAITSVIADFNDTESDDIRRSIGKKKLDLMESYHHIFIDRSINKGYTKDLTTLLWSKIEAAANYSFNKSHAVGYSITSYFCGYLKTYYLSEFMISVANFADKKDKRIKIFGEMKKDGIQIELPNINKSQEQIAKVDGKVMLGLSLIDGVGSKAMEDIFKKRPFTSFSDLVERKDSRRVHKGVMNSLIESGAIDIFGERDYLSAINNGELPPDEGQSTLFETTPSYTRWSDQERLFREYNRIRLSPNQNLIDFYEDKDISKNIHTCSIHDTLDINTEYEIYIKALVSDYESKGEYGYLTISDGEDSLSLYVSGKKQEKYFDVMSSIGEPILVKLHIKRSRATLDFLIDLKNNDGSSYNKEWDYVSGNIVDKINMYYEENKAFHWGALFAVSYFFSKNGTKCCSFGIKIDEKQSLIGKLICRNVPDNLEDGVIIGFFRNADNDFIDIERVIYD